MVNASLGHLNMFPFCLFFILFFVVPDVIVLTLRDEKPNFKNNSLIHIDWAKYYGQYVINTVFHLFVTIT